MKIYREAMEHLNRNPELSEKKWDLEKTIAAARETGLEKLPYLSAQVVGTNGKGTTCYLARQILSGHGRKVGLYTSPHLISVLERIQINQQKIKRGPFARLYHFLKPTFEKYQLSYFEKLTLLAVHYFCRNRVDLAVFETGLGARLDAVTAFQHPYLAITAISYDHQEYLGESLQEIAIEKSYPMKFADCIFALRQNLEVEKYLDDYARKQSKNIQWIAAQKTEMKEPGIHFYYEGQGYDLPMNGDHYADDAALAIALSQSILGKDFQVEKTQKALHSSKWPARLQWIIKPGFLPILLSCAHNRESLNRDLACAAKILENYCPDQVQVLFALSRNRPVGEFLSLVRNYFSRITLTQLPGHPLHDIPDDVHFISDYRETFSQLLPEKNDKQVILVIGSIYLCGQIMQYLSKDKL